MSTRWGAVEHLLRKASTGDAPDLVQLAARDLFDCAHALADDPTSVEARRQMLDAAFCVVRAARQEAESKQRERELQKNRARNCGSCAGNGGRHEPHPHADGHYVDVWIACGDCASQRQSEEREGK